jgi:hypothetical protein
VRSLLRGSRISSLMSDRSGRVPSKPRYSSYRPKPLPLAAREEAEELEEDSPVAVATPSGE